MASRTSIGGFFVDLGLNLDKNSFETGNKFIDGMTSGFNKLIGTARNAAVVLATTAVATSAMSSAEIKSAAALGVSTEALDNWKAAANIAGVNSASLVSSMGQLSNVINRIRFDGSGLDEYSKKLGFLRLSINDLKDLTTDQAYQKIFERAQEMIAEGTYKPQEIYAAMQGLVGDGGTNLLIELQRKGVSIGDFLNGASITQFMTAKNHEDGADFIEAVKTLKEQTESITKRLGTEVGAELEPLVRKISDFITDHKEDIINGIDKISEGIGVISEKVQNFGSWLFKDKDTEYQELVASLTGAAGSTIGAAFSYAGIPTDVLYAMLLEGATGVDALRLQEEYSLIGRIKKAGGRDGSISKKEITQQLIDDILRYQELGGDFDYLPLDAGAIKSIVNDYGVVPNRRLQDGIMRPDGTVTQVAPDDWVFAARNLGDLAHAFIPRNLEAAAPANTYNIVQNFTINGARDTAQVVRQQAYNGARDGLMSTMQGSSLRLQQMSGTR